MDSFCNIRCCAAGPGWASRVSRGGRCVRGSSRAAIATPGLVAPSFGCSAGGVGFASLTDALMLRELPGVFCAGEMLDWEAPTGGYLLTACWASGQVAGKGVLGFLQA